MLRWMERGCVPGAGGLNCRWKIVLMISEGQREGARWRCMMIIVPLFPLTVHRSAEKDTGGRISSHTPATHGTPAGSVSVPQ